MSNHSEFWTDARVNILRAGYVAGNRARVIADAIGGGCTRNMVIGKANRLGLGKPRRTLRRWRKRAA